MVLVFMVRYLKEVMLLKGQINDWVSITDLNSASVMKLPRAELLAVSNLCQENFMYFLHKSYYVQVGWDCRLFYNAVAWSLAPETKAKMSLTAERNPAELKTVFHPC